MYYPKGFTTFKEDNHVALFESIEDMYEIGEILHQSSMINIEHDIRSNPTDYFILLNRINYVYVGLIIIGDSCGVS